MDVQEARNGSDVDVHADDVDILCLLMHHCKDVLGEVFFQTLKKTYESRQRGTKMSIRMSMSVSWITSYFDTHGVGAT